MMSLSSAFLYLPRSYKTNKSVFKSYLIVQNWHITCIYYKAPFTRWPRILQKEHKQDILDTNSNVMSFIWLFGIHLDKTLWFERRSFINLSPGKMNLPHMFGFSHSTKTNFHKARKSTKCILSMLALWCRGLVSAHWQVYLFSLPRAFIYIKSILYLSRFFRLFNYLGPEAGMNWINPWKHLLCCLHETCLDFKGNFKTKLLKHPMAMS